MPIYPYLTRYCTDHHISEPESIVARIFIPGTGACYEVIYERPGHERSRSPPFRVRSARRPDYFGFWVYSETPMNGEKNYWLTLLENYLATGNLDSHLQIELLQP